MDKELKTIDCFGEICPVPILKIEDQLKTIQLGDEFKLVTDHSCTIESIKEIYTKKGMIKKIEEVMNGVWEVIIVKR